LKKVVKSRSKVCLLPVEVAGYQEALAHGLSELGWHVRPITISHHPFDYRVKVPNPAWATFVSDCVRYVSGHQSGFLPKAVFLMSIIARAVGTLWVALNFRVVILNAGRSLLPFHIDLILYKALGIRIIAMMGHGSEARPPCLDCLGEQLESTKISKLAIECKRRRSYVRRVEALSNVVISTPTIGHYLTKEFVNGNDIGMPVLHPNSLYQLNLQTKSASDYKVRVDPSIASPLKVVHAPSDPKVKGSKTITSVLQQLESEGLVEFKLVTGLSNQRVQETLAWADLLIDQLYSDLPLPVLASEAAFFGVPTMIGSNNWPEVRRHFTHGSWPPAIYINPADLEQELRKHVEDFENLTEIGRLAKSFVEKHRTPRTIATIYESIILGETISHLEVRLFDPQKITYRAGCGSAQRVLDEVSNHAHLDGKTCWAN
jgi:hypothetical protein